MLIAATLFSKAQKVDTLWLTNNIAYGSRHKRVKIDSAFILPYGGDTATKYKGLIKYLGESIYYANGSKWNRLLSEGGNTIPTWQQTLLATNGRILTEDNTIDAFNTNLTFDNLDLIYFSSNISDPDNEAYFKFSKAGDVELFKRYYSAPNITDRISSYMSMEANASNGALSFGVIGGDNNSSNTFRVYRGGVNFAMERMRAADIHPNFSINGSANPTTAAFEVNDEAVGRGVLLTRLTEAQKNAIPIPPAGLLTYQTDGTPGYYYYNGSSWDRVGTGTGTVTSVGLTMPTGFSVSGSPVTNSGIIAITTELNGYVKANGSGFTAAATIPFADVTDANNATNLTTGTLANARLTTNVGYSISHAIGGGVSTAAGTTEFIINGPTGASATEAIRQVPISVSGTIRSFYIYTTSMQPATGSYVATLRVNGANTSTAITLSAGTVAGVYSSTTTTSVNAGDLLSIRLVNNATSASATLRAFSIFVSAN